MQLSTTKRISYGIIGTVLSVLLIQGTAALLIWVYLTVMPFGHFVKITKLEAHPVQVGERTQKYTLERKARFNISATSNKEIYRIDNSIPNQLYQIPEASFIYEKDGNDKELMFELELNKPVLIEADFYTIDKVCIQLPKNVEKCDTLRADWESIPAQKDFSL